MKPTWKACGLKTAGMLQIVLSCFFAKANATCSSVAEYKVEMDGFHSRYG